MACLVCGESPHDPACAVRLGPGWEVPQRRPGRTGGPTELTGPDPYDWRGQRATPRRSPAEVDEARRLAAELSADGHGPSEIARALGISPGYASNLIAGRK
jgi:hypothetical protein